jgi:arsenate reductase
MGVPVRAVLRAKEGLAGELGLRDPAVGDEALLDAMMAHPVLIERPIVVAPAGVRLCRPAETVRELLPGALTVA